MSHDLRPKHPEPTKEQYDGAKRLFDALYAHCSEHNIPHAAVAQVGPVENEPDRFRVPTIYAMHRPEDMEGECLAAQYAPEVATMALALTLLRKEPDLSQAPAYLRTLQATLKQAEETCIAGTTRALAETESE